MPVDAGVSKHGVIFQREQYAKGGVTRRYWDFKDDCIIAEVGGARRVADIGCGEGILLEKLVGRLPDREVVGVDIDPINIEICQKHGLPIMEGGVYSLPFEDGSLDAALFIEVVEHLDDPLRAIAEINRVLRPGGRIIVLFPNDFTMKAARLMMLMFKEAFYDTGHLRQWTPRAMKGALEGCGFRVVRQRSLPLPPFFISLHHLTVGEKAKV